MLHDSLCNCLSLPLIGTGTTSVIQRIRQIVETHATGMWMLARRGKDHQFTVIELDVGYGNQ
ncbi:hypothetical protein D3C81_1817480 [compost metagenome]